PHAHPPSVPTRRSSDLDLAANDLHLHPGSGAFVEQEALAVVSGLERGSPFEHAAVLHPIGDLQLVAALKAHARSFEPEDHRSGEIGRATSELQSHLNLV